MTLSSAKREAGCILCGGTPTTKAHVIPRVIRNALPGDGRTANVVSQVVEMKWPRRAKLEIWDNGSNMLNVQPRVLCAVCNNDWMSQLEDKGAPLVARVIRQEVVEMPAAAQSAVAAWALSAAIVRGEVATRVPSVDRRLSRTFREEGLADLPVAVGIVHVEPSLDFSGEVASTFISVIPELGNGSITVFWLLRTAVVVATGELAAEALRGLRFLNRAAAQIWPVVDENITVPAESSVAPRSLLRSMGIPVDGLPPESLQPREGQRGRLRLDAFMFPERFRLM